MISIKQVRVLAVVYITMIALLAVLPINGSDSHLNNNYTFSIRWDYLVHAAVMIPLVAMLFVFFHSSNLKKETKGQSHYFTILIISLAIATICEFIQLFLPYRTFNINDLYANVIGVCIGFVLVLFFQKSITKGLA